MHFKRAGISDVPVIHSLMISAFNEYRNDDIPSSALKERIVDIEKSIKYEGEEVMIAYRFNEPVAMVRFKISNQILNFYRVSVDPLYQGNNIAKTLLKELEKYAISKDIFEMICKVRMNVKRNIKIYSDLGYVIFDEYFINKDTNQKLKIISMKKEL
ncbi:GNAT family N-acetyltransferase [Staphylococcus succinus]|nr:GNAT family N-acetyltransferase [Staphylococcus succinus]RIN24669.1 GNAT family N-acetyltransferase [Staphylococcus succinus]